MTNQSVRVAGMVVAMAGLAAGCSTQPTTVRRYAPPPPSSPPPPPLAAGSPAPAAGPSIETASAASPARGGAEPARDAAFARPWLEDGATWDARAGRAGRIGAGWTPVRGAPGGTIADQEEGLRRITEAGDGAAFDPCASRDGSWLVFASTQHRPTADLYRKAVDGNTITQLTADPASDIMPSISPDGRRIAFSSDRGGAWNIYVMSSSGGQAVEITRGSSPALHPTWSADGSRLAYCTLGEVSGRWELWVTEVDRPSPEFVGYGMFPQWRPVADSAAAPDKILFQRSRERGDRAFSVWTVDYEPGRTSAPTEIVRRTEGAVINPSWSPDGMRVIYSVVGGPLDGSGGRVSRADLFMCNVDGTSEVAMTTGGFANLSPAWARDGRVYFVSDRGGSEDIWSIGTEKALLAAGEPSGDTDVASAPTP